MFVYKLITYYLLFYNLILYKLYNLNKEKHHLIITLWSK